MSLKVIIFSAQVFLIKTALGQCIGNIGSSYDIGICEGLIGNSYGISNPCGWSDVQLPRPQLTIPDCGIVSASYGGGLNVQAISSIAPGGISVHSENQIQGPLSVYGTLPFLGTVALEGPLPTYGSGAVTYQCGDGRVGIFEENISAPGYDRVAPGSFGAGSNSFGVGWGLERSGIKEISSCVEPVPNVCGRGGGYGFNCNKGVKCGCGY